MDTGLILARYGQQVDIEMPQGKIERIYLQRKFNHVVTGDKVLLETHKGHFGVVSVLPRSSMLEKHDAHGKRKGIAANIDQLLLVIAPEPKPTFGLIDDYLVMAESLHIKPVIVLNKMDLLPEFSHSATAENPLLLNILEVYQHLPYPLIPISTLNHNNISLLIEQLKGKTNILVGQSGVGKSSIIKCLIPDLEIRINMLSRQQGKHTTTTTRLYHLPHGGALIDSPGVRSFTLSSMSDEKVATCFVEFQPYLGHCRFHNCRHTNEPDCAILAALETGNIIKSRYESYQRLIRRSL